ncbi:MAG TPA: GvpL/GvpF family gas vesicle protein [Terriglobales bacterium]|nr:GvpL/GvpF family gas vesicle protein [Terriglobales bacterium]
MAVPVNKKQPGKVAPKITGPMYFYGVSQMPQTSGTSKTGVPPRVTAPGIDSEHKVEAIPLSGALCWITRVSPDFIEELERRMEDLEWLSEASVLHQRAVSAISAQVELLPARFGTVFLSSATLETHVDSQKEKLQKAFKRIAGAEEWGVKVFLTSPAAGRAAVAASSGKDYLQQKAKALAVQNTRRNVPDTETHKLASALGRLSRAVAPTGKVSGAQPGLQWQASFLLPRAKRKQWDTVLKRFAQRWGDSRRIECTGPWPPYSFVE